MRKAKLIMVTEENNNKFYNMEERSGDIKVTWGRVGQSGQTSVYPVYKWDSLYKSKIRKGYKDMTELVRSVSTRSGFAKIDNESIDTVVNFLVSRSRQNVSSNYLVTGEDVTRAQIESAQKIIDSISLKSKKIDVSEINKSLIQLYQTIPRSMRRVQDHLIEAADISVIAEKIKSEQELLDNMSSQVSMSGASCEHPDKTMLEHAGLEMYEVTHNDVYIIKRALGSSSRKFISAFRVKHRLCEDRFNKHVESSKNKKIERMWHGSRTENWWSIMSTGLAIRPSNAVHTGSMFGTGIYFADRSEKSIGYTSLSGSRWASGSDNRAFMCLYKVHVGSQKIIERHDSSCYKLCSEKIKPHDSVFAKAGVSLYNNEFIIYKSEQCTPEFLVEIGKR